VYDTCTGLFLAREESTRKSPAPDSLCPPSVAVSSSSEIEPEMHISPWGKPSPTPTEISSTYGLIPARTRVFIRQLDLSSPTTRTRLPFHSWPAQMIQRPRQRAFLTLKEPQLTSSITRGLIILHSMKDQIGLQSNHGHRLGGHIHKLVFYEPR
jgi:hypothetical protein